jgi:hypothetical protein
MKTQILIKKKTRTGPYPSLDDASFVEEAILRGLRPDPQPHEDEDGGEPHPAPL